MKRQHRLCGALLKNEHETCWYCHRPLVAADIVTVGVPNPAPRVVTTAGHWRTTLHAIAAGWYAWWRGVDRFFEGVGKVIGFCLVAAVVAALAILPIYLLVRFVHWAWYR